MPRIAVVSYFKVDQSGSRIATTIKPHPEPRAQAAQPHDVAHNKVSPINDVIKEVTFSHVWLHSLLIDFCAALKVT